LHEERNPNPTRHENQPPWKMPIPFDSIGIGAPFFQNVEHRLQSREDKPALRFTTS
jgi:hypothetical protein